ncbi:thiamine-binding protein [Streptomyces sp. CT34]|uniref:thiamine-binding protein n=1 Tax=Streptomyces sp. CT34 TaxID=1553907 RepID=UPI001F51CFC1|nr:thiamine-binding protein [Streptomyces sp. CT34]
MSVIKRATEAVALKAPRVQVSIKVDLWPNMPAPSTTRSLSLSSASRCWRQ